MLDSVRGVSDTLDELNIKHIAAFKFTNSYFYLSMALHSIMDAYAPNHKGMQVFGDSWIDWVSHIKNAE